LRSSSSDLSSEHPLSGQVVVFSGKLSSLGRKDARALVARLGGAAADDVDEKTTMLVVGVDTHQKLKRAEELNATGASRIEILTEDQFCSRAGLPTLETLKQQYHALRDLMARYRSIREDHVRYLVKCGLIRPAHRTYTDTFFAFGDVAVIKQVNDELDNGASFRSIVRSLGASRQGQLAFDFKLQAEPAKILALKRRVTPDRPDAPPSARDNSLAEEYFLAGSLLDDEGGANLDEAATAYRKALELNPYLVAALINLANIHYSRDELAEAQALYERAIGLEPDFYEAHFNLGNIYHDLARFPEALACYREALRLNPGYADAHFYVAVTFEKMGQSQEARPHWRAYQQLAPNGEWVELAREFSE